MLACETESKPPAYVLFIEAPDVFNKILQQLGVGLETVLQENFHYRYCRDLGQLGALRVFRIDSGAMAAYLAACQAHGQRVGDIKPVALHRRGGWAEVFQGRMIT
jgi:hypothetical protein